MSKEIATSRTTQDEKQSTVFHDAMEIVLSEGITWLETSNDNMHQKITTLPKIKPDDSLDRINELKDITKSTLETNSLLKAYHDQEDGISANEDEPPTGLEALAIVMKNDSAREKIHSLKRQNYDLSHELLDQLLHYTFSVIFKKLEGDESINNIFDDIY